MITRGNVKIWEQPDGWQARLESGRFILRIDLDRSVKDAREAALAVRENLLAWAREAQEAAALLAE